MSDKKRIESVWKYAYTDEAEQALRQHRLYFGVEEVRKLLSALTARDEEIAKLMAVSTRMALFVTWAMTEGPWSGCDLDGGSVQERAHELGLIKRVSDDWYVLAHDVTAAIPPSPQKE